MSNAYVLSVLCYYTTARSILLSVDISVKTVFPVTLHGGFVLLIMQVAIPTTCAA